MTIEERQILAQKPIVWTGDLADDCTALWAGLMLRAEWMDEDYWWWAVYDMQKEEVIIDDSNGYSESFIGGNVARNKAEDIAASYIAEITKQEAVAKFLVAGVFKLTGRGIVLMGNITEGHIFIGDTVEFIAFGTLYRRNINDMGGFTKPHRDKCNIGLVISHKTTDEVEYLGGWKPIDILTTIYRKKSDGAV